MSEHRKEKGHVTPSKRQKTLLPSSQSPSKLPLTACGFGDCDFSTRYHSNMTRHRKRRNHFLNDEERDEANAEAKRDEIAKQMEEAKLSSEENNSEEEEMDVTIPLSKKYSPSKITDYFKPVTTPKRKSLDAVRKTLDMNNHEESNNDDSKKQVEDGASNAEATNTKEATAAPADNKTQPEKPDASDNNDFVQTNKTVLEQ